VDDNDVKADGSQVRSLYICYFGIREPLVQTQVVPYLRDLAESGIDVSLLSYEPHWSSWTPAERKEVRERLTSDGIRWVALPYHKRPSAPATAYDILNGARVVSRLIGRERIDVLHARGHVSAAIAALAKWRRDTKLIFDIRGFMPEEYVDAGVWRRGGLLNRVSKRTERWLLEAADGFVVLTEDARSILFPGCVDSDYRGRPLEVIPCCVDIARFRRHESITRDEAKRSLGLSGRKVLVYVGALGGWYMTEEMAELMSVARRRYDAYSLILTQSDPSIITTHLKHNGLTDKDFFAGEVKPEDVPIHLAASDLALSLIKPCYSKRASSPTKVAEYLAAGLPVICNAGIGDLDGIIEADRTGVLLTEFTGDAYARVLDRADALLGDPELHERCRESAHRRFDLKSVGGRRYRRLYDRVLSAEPHSLLVEQQAL
jgi:glycosyltransferase involved in cell wall biosynthesis